MTPLKLNGDDLPWVEKALHLGNTLTTEMSKSCPGMEISGDLLQKRAIFFKNVHELKQAYGFYEPKIICEIIRIFGTSFYGSPLWALYSKEHQQLLRSWNTMVKIVWDLPYATHKRFVESLTEVPHLQTTLHSRYIGFIKNLKDSTKAQLQMLFSICQNNQFSNTGRNISELQNEYELESVETLINKKHVIKNMRVNALEEGEEWKVKFLEELSLVKKGFLEVDMDMQEKDMDLMLESVAVH